MFLLQASSRLFFQIVGDMSLSVEGNILGISLLKCMLCFSQIVCTNAMSLTPVREWNFMRTMFLFSFQYIIMSLCQHPYPGK